MGIESVNFTLLELLERVKSAESKAEEALSKAESAAAAIEDLSSGGESPPEQTP